MSTTRLELASRFASLIDELLRGPLPKISIPTREGLLVTTRGMGSRSLRSLL